MPDIQLNELVEINPLRPKIDLNPMDEVSFIPMSDVSESGRWINHQSRQFGDVSRSYTYFEEGDVLFAKITPCMENGKGCYPRNLANGIGFASTEFHVIRAKENADASFLYQWSIYKPLRLKASATMIGSAGQQRVPTSFLESFKVPAIAKQEQIKIAEILSTVDQAIDQTESLVAKQQRIKTGLMQDLLTGNVAQDWKSMKLTDLAEYINGYAFKPEDWGEHGLPIIRIEQLKNPDSISDYYSGRLPEHVIIDNGDLIFSWSASLFLSIWEDGKAALNQHLFKVIEKDGVDRQFLKQFMEFHLPEITSVSHGSTMQHITRKELNRFRAAFPCNQPEQTKIAEILSTVDQAINQTEALIAKQQRIKTALMQDLLTGKVSVTPLLTEAEVGA